MTLHPALAAVRLAVRRSLADLDEVEAPVVVACSGGADSLALLAASVFEARSRPWRVIGATIDHGLQEGSPGQAERLVGQMAAIGVDETVGARVSVDSGGRGIEAAAREARYAVLEQVAEQFGAPVVLLGHTLDDQAETVLLGLTRGSGGRSIAGMRPEFDRFRRPLLGLTRATTEAACDAEDLDFWRDPQNADPRFTRVRVRHRVLPVLEEELGPGVTATLARTAEQLRPDMELLDALAESALAQSTPEPGSLDLANLTRQPAAIRSRVVRLAALAAGAPPSEVFHVHVTALVDLVGGAVRGEVQLPGHLTAYRDGDRLRFRRTSR